MRANGFRTDVVTGATSGIGRALIEILASKGGSVIGVGRGAARCDETRAELEHLAGAGHVAICRADLSLQTEVRALAAEISDLLDRWGAVGLDGLVNNAGTFTFWQTLTPEGFETQWAVNHLAPFLLTNELLPRLAAAPQSRVVTVSSGSHYRTKLDWEDIQLLRRYQPLRAYEQTKLANVLFTAELNRRLDPGAAVQAFAADPGLVKTDIGGKTNSRLAGWIWRLRRRSGIPAQQSAEGIAELLLDPEKDIAQGIYWKHGRPKEPNPYALEPAVGGRLWELSARMCGLVEVA